MKKYTKGEIASYIERYRTGAVSIRKFCKNEDIALGTFTNWLYSEKNNRNKNKNKNNKVENKVNNKGVEFCKIEIPKVAVKMEYKVCIEYKGVKVHLGNYAEIFYFEKILEAVINI